MKYPFVSFIAAFFCYFLLVGIFCFSFSRENKAPLVSLTIDADIIGKINQHQASKVKKKSSNLEKISDERKYQKSLDEKIEPKEDNPAKEEKEEFKKISQKIAPIYQPLPEIPSELRFEAFHSKAIARFFVLESGEVKKVEFIKATSNPRLNHLLLRSLEDWKFPPNSSGFIQEINVTFTVE